MAENRRRTLDKHHSEIDILPDEILLGIFDFYVNIHPHYGNASTEEWQPLVWVCRRWRGLVFESPRRLSLGLYFTPKTRTRDKLNIWPALPLIVRGDMAITSGTDNIIAALEQSNRVSHVTLWNLVDWQMEDISDAMQFPFPELTDLWLSSHDETLPVIPDLFLGGSAPRLRTVDLNGIPFQGLPDLLLSATHLVQLRLTNIPLSGYISPERFVALLCISSSLREFCLEFQSPHSRPDRRTRRQPSPKRSILPTLENFTFNGTAEYLENLVNRIDAPQLHVLNIEFFEGIDVDSDCPRLAEFINRTPKHSKRDEAHLQFNDWNARLRFGILQIIILCRDPDLQVSSITQVCNSSISSTVEDLYIEYRCSQLVWKNDAIESTLWSQLLLPFTAVKNLYISEGFTSGIAAALQEVGDGIIDLLPRLQNISVGKPEPFEKNTVQFVVRQLSGRPVAIFDLAEDSDEDMPDVDSDTE